MATTRAIITRALKELRVIGPGEDPEASEANDCLDKLNGIMHELATSGTTYEHTDLTLSDAFPFADELINPSVMWLAKNCSGLFGASLTQDQYDRAKEGEEAIFAAYYTVPDSSFDAALYRLPGNRRYWSSS